MPGGDASDTAEAAARPGPIAAASWAGDVVFAITAVPAALGVHALEDPAIVVCLVLFFASLLVWTWALAAAFLRSARGDDVAVTTLFLLEGRVPRPVRRSLYGALAAGLVVTAVTVAANPFGVLVPMYPLGLVGLWGARHGAFPPRRDLPSR